MLIMASLTVTVNSGPHVDKFQEQTPTVITSLEWRLDPDATCITEYAFKYPQAKGDSLHFNLKFIVYS